MNVLSYALVGAALAFAYSMGAHYTGACMGMPHAAGAIRADRALLLMAPLTFLGAALASEGVEATVGHGLVGAGALGVAFALGIVIGAFVLTTIYNFAKVPTSTIQILVFCIVGAALAEGLPVAWGTVGTLLILWAIAPFAALGLGWAATRFGDRFLGEGSSAPGLSPRVAAALVVVGAGASFAMGANDVSNASGSFLMVGLFSPLVAGAVGGVGLALGALTWGRPLLRRVAFEVVELDGRTATGAQFAQAAVVLGYVAFGYFTSMNQALIGAMIGSGLARGGRPIRWKVVRGILLGWVLGPASGAAVGYAITVVSMHVGLL